MNSMTLHSPTPHKRTRLLAAVPVAMLLALYGCASQTTQQETFRIPPGSKVALSTGSIEPAAWHTERLQDPADKRHASSERKSHTVEATKHIPEGIAGCTAEGLLVAFPLCALVVPIMLPTLGLTGDVIAMVKEAAQDVSNQDTEKPKSAEELAKERKAAEELAKERKAADEKLAAMQGTIAKHVTGTITTLDARRLLVIRVQSYARESGVGDFAHLTNSKPQGKQDKVGYDKKADYVFEIAVSDPRLEIDCCSPYSWFYFRSRGRLVRANDNLVVDTYIARATTNLRQLDEWTAGDQKDLSAELDEALDRLAKELVDKWIKPALKGPG